MPDFWSKTLIPTSREVPAEAEVPSHQLMLRGGLIRKLTAGVYDYLPLGLRSLHKAMRIVREEMNAAGAVEVLLPALQPIELWEKTGRRNDLGDNLFVVKDRHGREEALGATHEEVMTELIAAYAESYRQLPLNLYQIQTKFRDEFRPRFGVLRSREFQMKDAYSFDASLEGLDRSYQAMYDAYCRVFDRCGLSYVIVEAESGDMGGSGSQQFTVTTPTGEDTIFVSDKDNYSANLEKCATGRRDHQLDGDPTGELQEVHTPECNSIQQLCESWQAMGGGGTLKPSNTLKSLLFKVKDATLANDDPLWVLAVVRGDHEINQEKLRDDVRDPQSKSPLDDVSIEMADEADAHAAGFEVGFIGPHIAVDRADVWLVIDPDAAQHGFWVTGANRKDYHVRHFDWLREMGKNDQHEGKSFLINRSRCNIADIRNAIDGDPSPRNDGGVLTASRGIEVGQVFKLGTKYSKALGAVVLDEQNQRVPILMGSYGIGINRILAAAIESEGGHDDDGMIWPAGIAPYAVLITPIKYEGQVRETADRLAGEIEELRLPGGEPIDVLIDDRAERPGVKFKDADLIGIPLRITIGDKALKDGNVEVKPRTADKPTLVPVAEAAAKVAELLSG